MRKRLKCRPRHTSGSRCNDLDSLRPLDDFTTAAIQSALGGCAHVALFASTMQDAVFTSMQNVKMYIVCCDLFKCLYIDNDMVLCVACSRVWRVTPAVARRRADIAVYGSPRPCDTEPCCCRLATPNVAIFGQSTSKLNSEARRAVAVTTRRRDVLQRPTTVCNNFAKMVGAVTTGSVLFFWFNSPCTDRKRRLLVATLSTCCKCSVSLDSRFIDLTAATSTNITCYSMLRKQSAGNTAPIRFR